MHQLAVTHLVRAADLEDRVSLLFEFQSVDQVRDHVLDGDGLGRRTDPLRSDHHRQLVHQRPDQLERQRARADHDGSPELDGRRPLGRQDVADLLPAREVRRELALAESTEVDDPPDSPLPRGAGEVARAGAVLLLEVAGRPHRVHEVVGGVNPPQGGGEGLGVQDVPPYDLRVGSKAAREVLGTARQTAHPVAAGFESRDQPAADVTARAGNEDEPGSRSVPGSDDWRPRAS